jgi:hypothetical protein
VGSRAAACGQSGDSSSGQPGGGAQVGGGGGGQLGGGSGQVWESVDRVVRCGPIVVWVRLTK